MVLEADWPATPADSGHRLRRPHPAYSIQYLRDDLERFILLLGGSDGERFLTTGRDQPGERRPDGNLPVDSVIADYSAQSR
jgi:hypothetical protein